MRSTVTLATALLALGLGLPGSAEEWFLSEFDWGDSLALVDESVRVSPGFRCGFVARRCAVVSVDVDGEELLAQFGYFKGGLYRIRVGTPPLPRSSPHLKRIWEHLLSFLTREKGAPERAGTFPELAGVRAGDPVVTHVWRFPDQEIHLEVDRQKGDYRVGAAFLDPVRAAQRRAALERAAGSTPEDEAPRAEK
jgi:hypothetical protein